MTSRTEELAEELVVALRESRMRKCSSDALPFTERAKELFADAVDESGGNREVAGRIPCNESNVRLMRRHPDRSPTIEAIGALDPDEIDRFAALLRVHADEKRGMKRAG
jgi:hypothetical protein